MSQAENPPGNNPDPWQFIANLPVYRDFTGQKDTSSSEDAPNQIIELPSREADGIAIASYQLHVGGAYFRMDLEIDRAVPFATISFPSRIDRIDPKVIHPFIATIVHTAFPFAQRSYIAPSVALIENGSETNFDLSNSWHDERYRESIENSTLSEVIYYFHISPNSIPTTMPPTGPRASDFAYGFILAGDNSLEFIKMPYLIAKNNGEALAGIFLPRSREYLGGNKIEDAQVLAGQIKDVCNAHPPRILHPS